MLYTQPFSQQRGQASAFRGPPRGARQNDLSAANLPYNLWGAAAQNRAAQQYGGTRQVQSWTMPGSMQSYNDRTGQPIGQATPSWDGNNAYAPVSNRAGPVNWATRGLDGTQYSGQQGWQQAAATRDAFAGQVIGRLGQYQTGKLTGTPSFDFQSLLSQANESLRNNSWQNPFLDPRARTPQPSMSDPSYSPARPDITLNDGPNMGRAQPIQPPSLGQQYDPLQARPSLPDIPGGLTRAPSVGPQTPAASKAWEIKPPSQWTDADWAAYTAHRNTPRNDLYGGRESDIVDNPYFYRDRDGRAKYYRGYGIFNDGKGVFVDGDWAWNEEQKARREREANPTPRPTFYSRGDAATPGMALPNDRPAWLDDVVPPPTHTRQAWGDVVTPPTHTRPAEESSAAESIMKSGLAAGWSKGIEDPGWMSPSGKYWDGSGTPPWLRR